MLEKRTDVEGVLPRKTLSIQANMLNPTRHAIKTRRQMVLSAADSEAFVDAVLNPRPVNARLRETVRRYRELAGI